MKYQNSRVTLYAVNLNKKLSDLPKIKFVRDTFILQAGTAVTLALNAITSIFLARILGPSGYGTYGLIFSLYGLFRIIGDVGIWYSTLTRLSEAYARGDRKSAIELLAFLIKVSAVTAILILMLGMIGAPYLASKLYDNPEIGHLVRFLCLIPSLGIIYSLVTVVLQSVGKIKSLTALESLEPFSISLLVISFVLMGLGLRGIIYGHVLTSFLVSVIGLLIYFKLQRQLGNVIPSFKEILKKVPRVEIKKYFSLGFLISVNKNIEKLIENVPILILGSFVLAEQVAYFKIAIKAAAFLPVLTAAISRNLASRLPERLGKGDIKGLRKNFIKVSLYSGIISLSCTFIFIIILPYLIRYLYGIQYMPAVGLFYILSIYAATSGFRVGLAPLYRTVERVDLSIKVYLLLLIILTPVGLILIKYFKTMGAAIFVSMWHVISTFISSYIALRIIDQPERWGKVIKES